MQGAFVIQLRKCAEGGQLEGSVEEVDTGIQMKFRSDTELIKFLQERYAKAPQRQPRKEGTNE